MVDKSAFQPAKHLVIFQTEDWVLNQRVDSALPGYLVLGARMRTNDLSVLRPEAVAQLGTMTSVPANAALLPERVKKVAQERLAAGSYQTLVFGVVEDSKSEVVTFGKLDDGKAPGGDTVYEIASVSRRPSGLHF